MTFYKFTITRIIYLKQFVKRLTALLLTITRLYLNWHLCYSFKNTELVLDLFKEEIFVMIMTLYQFGIT
jgi:hypothetical protein